MSEERSRRDPDAPQPPARPEQRDDGPPASDDTDATGEPTQEQER
jgi:hypothetical protein